MRCSREGENRYGRVLGVCYVGGLELNRWLVGAGGAVAYRYYSTEYVPEEEAVRAAYRGIRSNEFIPPWQWRQAH